MPKSHANEYDTVIIGAGMSGLVCGCYLAKAGMKVLIAEQHSKPGGYCTSFKRQGFIFDAAAHSFGGYKTGHAGKVFKYLEIEKKVNFIKIDPSDLIITPDFNMSFWSDTDRTITEFQRAFPQEKDNLCRFFSFLNNPDANFFVRMRRMTFNDLLDHYFTDTKLRAILAFPLFGNGGLPPSKMSAFIGTKIYQEFLLDGGYYPEGGMQNLADALAEKFKELGGELHLSCPVKKIRVNDGKVTGVVLEKNEFIPSKYVISNCDARQTFIKLLGEKIINADFIKTLKSMIPSLSGFIVYLGVDKDFDQLPSPGTNLWYLSHYNLDSAFSAARDGKLERIGGYVTHVSPDKRTVFAFMNAPFKNRNFWVQNKMKFLDFFINRIESEVIPGLSKHIIYKDAATPHTLYRYTSNYKGATFGWATIPSQLADLDLRKPSFMKNLFLTGHWTTHGLGIPGVVYLGYDLASVIIKKEKLI